MVERLNLFLICLILGLGAAPGWMVAQTESEEKPAAEQAADSETQSSQIASEDLLPPSTKAWFSVPDIELLNDQFMQTQLGKFTQDEALKPFIDDLKNRMQSWVNEKNVRLGLKIEDLKSVRTGEICLAGVLPGGIPGEPDKIARGAHGTVLLVDVTGAEDEALELLKQVNADLEQRKAKRQEIPDMHGVKVTKWVMEQPKNRLRKSRESFHALVNGWLLASDNENIFRSVVQRVIKADQLDKMESLGGQDSFIAVGNQTDLGGNQAHARWYVEPWGYLELAQAIEAEKAVIKQQDNSDRARKLKQQGFDAIRGIGGKMAFATSSRELLHQTFVYMPKVKSAAAKQKRVFGLMDFENRSGDPLLPEPFVPTDVSGYVSGTWNMSKAFTNFGDVFDAFTDPGAFEEIIEGLKNDPVVRVDVPWMVEQLGDRISVFSATRKIETDPEDDKLANPEQVAICLQVVGEKDELFSSIKRALGKDNVETFTFAGHPAEIILNDTSLADAAEDEADELILILPGEEGEEDDEEEKEVEQFELFEKRYITLFENGDSTYVIIANEKEFLKQILLEKVEEQLSAAADYTQVHESLSEFVNEDQVVWRQFGRVDKALAANYELLRQNKMAQANTVLARVLNEVLKPEDADEEELRKQKIDGSKLPADYDNQVAPYLGPMGWAMELTDDGLRVTGVLLKKNLISEVVQKPADTERR